MDLFAVVTLLSTLLITLIVNGAGLLSIRNARLKDKAELIVKLAEVEAAKVNDKAELTVKLAEIEASKVKDNAAAVAAGLDLESRLTDQVLLRATKESERLSLRVLALEKDITSERNARHAAEDAQEKIRDTVAKLQQQDRDREVGILSFEHSLIGANLSVSNLTSEVAVLRAEIVSLTSEVVALKAMNVVKDSLILALEGNSNKAVVP